ncbi:MAG: hypothetical protein ABIO67_12895 [Mycobacteriales bacterium]
MTDEEATIGRPSHGAAALAAIVVFLDRRARVATRGLTALGLLGGAAAVGLLVLPLLGQD